MSYHLPFILHQERGDETPTSNASSAADTSDVNLEYTHLSALQLLVAGDENHFSFMRVS